jgi:hypothetical protein
MLRLFLCFALLFLVAPTCGWAQPSAKDAKDAKDAKTKDAKTKDAKTKDAKTKDAKTTLAKRVTFQGVDDPQTILRDVLEYITDRHGLKIDVDMKRFKAVEVNDVLTSTMGRPLPAQKNVSVGVVLQQALTRLPVSATYVVRGNGVLVVPVSKEAIEAINQEAKGSLAKARLTRKFTADPALAEAPTFDNLVSYLKDKHDLQLVVSAGVDPADYNKYKLQRPRSGTVNLQTLLQQVAAQTNATVLLRHDHVLLITPDALQPAGQ